MALTLAEIEEKIKEYKASRDLAEKKYNSLIENIELKRMQNGNDSVELQNINDIMNNLSRIIDRCDNEIDKLERMKLSFCEKRKLRSKLKIDFYGY